MLGVITCKSTQLNVGLLLLLFFKDNGDGDMAQVDQIL